MSSSGSIAKPAPAASNSAWAPFKHRAFALLWVATLISNVGTWMHDVGAGWLMTTLNSSPAVVSLVQAATTLPVFIFALYAGTLADRLDKRKLLITVNVVLLALVSVLTVLVQLELVTPTLLILFTLAIGTGTAFMAPAWQAIVPTLVPRDALQPAIALNSMGINISRAIGPALAGVLIASVSLAAPFAVNAVSYLVIIGALLFWKHESAVSKTSQPVFNAMMTGMRHVAHNGPLKATLIRSFAFFIFASAYWALLPLVVRTIEGGGATLYGLLLTLIGAGAVVGALTLPQFRAKLDASTTAAGGTIGTAVAMAILATATTPPLAYIAALLGGFSWIAVLTTFNVSAQTALPNWVRARGLAVNLMVFFGSMAFGSAIWGQVATATSVSITLLIAAGGLIVGLLLTRKFQLGQGEDLDLTPSMHWPAPQVALEEDDLASRGPVMVEVEYRIRPEDEAAFLSAIKEWSGERWRDGAYDWRVFQSAEEPELWVEAFMVSSWQEHLAQHERVSQQDQDLQRTVSAFDTRESGPVVRHLIAP
ncbi:MFS transporter [Ruegeria sp. ANG-S4]|uniref:MFS transporter n=1 Tax=Ruegeria sp. ANG-S4 TaxID=1577904 RepID=UPI00058024F4|nr:MFS transporter [Ruegeria sp. ANG-S4]KIC43540.1 MFS transporter [Ruegeria sp. ANG-S4]